jgi:hypothetical protein
MTLWPILFVVGIFLIACGTLCWLWLLFEGSHPEHKARPPKKPLLSNWK